MALRDLIHGSARAGEVATAIPAISATQPKVEPATVARIATVAVATRRDDKGAGTLAAADVDRPRPLTADETRLLNWWLDAIGEDDPVCRRRVRELAEARQGARAFFIGCARERATTEHGS